MKGLFKFTTAALALLTMASCSSDDLFGNSESAQTPEEGALVVELENLIDRVSTRAAFVPDGKNNTIYWQNVKGGYSDFIEVFDDAMVKYDIYQFNKKKGSFVNIDEDDVTRVGEPKFALFGGGQFKTPTCMITAFGWDYNEDATTATFTVPSTITFGEDDNVAGTIAYKSNLPMWGEAAKDGDGVKVNMHYLTAVLRVYLKNAKANINTFKVEAFADQACMTPLYITGEFKATIATGGEPNADAQLEGPAKGVTGNSIVVNGINSASGDAYLYIPLIAQKYGALKFYVNGNVIQTTKPMELKRQTVYRLNLETMEVAGNTLESINVALEGQKDATADVNIATQQITESTTSSNTLKIPAGMKANINLTLKGLKKSISSPSTFVGIESEDGKYAGTLLVDASAAAATSDLSNIFINLPNADVVFVGGFTGTDFGQFSGSIDNDKLIVKSLSFVDPDEVGGFGANGIYVNKESTGFVLVGKGTTVNSVNLQAGEDSKPGMSEIVVDGNVSTISANDDKVNANVTVNADGKVTGAIAANGNVTIEGTAAAVTSDEGNITVGDEATVSGNITASKGKVSFTSKNKYISTITTGDLELGGKADIANAGIVKNFTMKGESKVGTVTIEKEGTAVIDVDAQKGKCEAITTWITLRPKSTLTLKQGYIQRIAQASEVTDETTPTLKFDDANNYSAIGSVDDYRLTIVGASKGNGKAPAVTGYIGTQVWTASQLADVANATGTKITLQNDIDLTNAAAWAMPALTKNFEGVDMKNYKGLDLKESKYPTISNVKIQNKDAKGKDIDNAGLFSTVNDKVEISNIIVKNAQVTLTGDKKNAGILAGSATGIIYVSNVNVDGSIETTAKFNNVGGLIGDAATPCIGWIDSATKDTKGVSVKLNKLQGQYNLGGFVGNISGKGWFNKCTLVDITGGITAVGAQNTFNVDKAADTKAGAIGLIAGNVADDIEIKAATVKDVIKGHKKELGFLADYIATISPVKIYCYFGSGTDNNVGKIPAGKKLILDSKTKTVPASPAQCEKADDFKDHNNYVLHSKYADFDK